MDKKLSTQMISAKNFLDYQMNIIYTYKDMNHHWSSQSPTRLIIMNTLDATQLDSTNHVRFPFNSSISAPRGHTLLVGISSFVMPMTIKVITSRNSILLIDVTTYTLTQGSPSAEELASEITALVPHLTVTYSSATGKFTLFNSTGNAMIISVLRTCFMLLGFNKEQKSVPAGGSLVSDAVADLAGPRVLHLHSNLNVMSMDSRSFDDSNVLTVIPVTAKQGEMLHYRGDELYQITSQNIKNLEFYLTDGLGFMSDLQGANWSIALSISVIPTPPSTIATNILSRDKQNGVPSLIQKTVKIGGSRFSENGKNSSLPSQKDGEGGRKWRQNPRSHKRKGPNRRRTSA